MLKCVPIMAKKLDEAVSLVGEALAKGCDMMEWRIDCLEDRAEPELFKKTWENIRELSDKPIIVTIRTTNQGGKAHMSISEYNDALRKLLELIPMEYVDVELTTSGSDAKAKMFAHMAKNKGTKAIISYHDMQYTSSARDIEMMLCRLKYTGADLPKVAYKANTTQDVANLKLGALKAHQQIGDIIAISMGELGQETRTNGDESGSVLTFTKPMGSAYTEDDDIGQVEL